MTKVSYTPSQVPAAQWNEIYAKLAVLLKKASAPNVTEAELEKIYAEVDSWGFDGPSTEIRQVEETYSL